MPTEPLFATTSLLDVAYESTGPANGLPLLLLHGWPDDVRTFDGVAPTLRQAGFRTIAPWLRGFGQTRFRSPDIMRSGQIAALAQDALELADAIGLDRFAIVGHDWGARIAYFLASLVPDRVTRIAALSLGWDPGRLSTPSLDQAQRFWYQWFMATALGAEFVHANGIAFARHQWQTWSPAGWFDEAVFHQTARSFENPDWPAVTLHSYRVRWGLADADPRYADIERAQQQVRQISVPTMVIHGSDDRCVGASTSEGKEVHFTGAYERHQLRGVGHFPTREDPATVARLLVRFLTER
ncbi:MAG TPA: alpha/beta hydrolase [Vicinamibacterales bacterium]|jgi:pimeloyl-ACP methyl ester carboxylesterase|nr:alpha/beta hydrolase [Vicinamibacterales bacterium]